MSGSSEGPPLWAVPFEGEGQAVVARQCPKCGRYIAGKSIEVRVNGLGDTLVTATCKTCGPIEPDFQGWF